MQYSLIAFYTATFLLFNYSSILSMSSPSLIQEEKQLLSSANSIITEYQALLESIEMKIKVESNLKSSVLDLSLRRDDDPNQRASVVQLTEDSVRNKNMSLFSYFLPDYQNSTMKNFYLLNLNNIDNQIRNEQNAKKKMSSEENFLILMVTNTSLMLYNNKGKLLTESKLNFRVEITSVDFSTFDEDNTIVILSEKSEIIVIRAEIQISGSSYESIHAEIFIPSRKTSGINTNDNPVSIQQHKLHGNKYIIITYEKGNIYVINKDLEIRSVISFQKSISRISIHNGILVIISHNDIYFLNMLGGNAVLLKCHAYEGIIDAVYDSVNSLMFVLDRKMRILVYQMKLSISKQNANECYVIYQIPIVNVKKETDDIRGCMTLIRSSLYIITGDNDHITIIDLNLLSEQGIVSNEFLIYKKYLQTQSIQEKKVINDILPISLSAGNVFILLNNPQQNDFLLLKVQHFPHSKTLSNKSTSTSSSTYDTTTSDNNFIVSLFYNTPSKNQSNLFYVYVAVIIILCIVIYIYKKYKKEEVTNKNAQEKGIENLNDEELQKMWEHIRKLEKYKEETDKKDERTKNKNTMDNSQGLEEDGIYEGEDMGEIEEEEEISDDNPVIRDEKAKSD